jgi:Holliday junction resolvase YEN1
VSIWFHHAAFSKGGENPELRGLFFRLVFLGALTFIDSFSLGSHTLKIEAKLPVIPVFVLDGRLRPKIKVCFISPTNFKIQMAEVMKNDII